MIYADYAATNGCVPVRVRQAALRYMDSPGNPGRGAHPAAMNAAREVLETRIAMAEFFGCASPEQVIFTSGATESLNLAIDGLIGPGHCVVTTIYEHNSVLRPLYRLGVELIVTDGSAEEMLHAIQNGASAVVMTHASNVTGQALDIHTVGKACREQGVLFIVDASQSAGILPVSLQDDCIDALCFSGHKGLLGLPGVGGLCLAEGIRPRAIKVGGTGIRSFEHGMPDTLPEALEAGTMNVPGIMALGAGIGEVRLRGLDCIAAHERSLAERLIGEIRDVPGVRIYGEGQNRGTGVVSLNLGNMDAGRVSDLLAYRYGIMTRSGAHCAPLIHEHFGVESTVRLSFGWENTEEDALACAQAIREIVKEG